MENLDTRSDNKGIFTEILEKVEKVYRAGNDLVVSIDDSYFQKLSKIRFLNHFPPTSTLSDEVIKQFLLFDDNLKQAILLAEEEF